MKDRSSIHPWLKRVDEIKVVRRGDTVTVVVPKNLHCALVGLLIDEALIRAGLHPNQLNAS